MKEAPATKAFPIKEPAQTCKTTVSKPGILLFIPKHFLHSPCTEEETQAWGGGRVAHPTELGAPAPHTPRSGTESPAATLG